jgi:segregation and condensation protein B
MEHEKALEALLFVSGEPVTLKEAARLLACNIATLETALEALSASLADRGIRVLRLDDKITLSTAPEASGLIEKLNRERLEGDLSRSALEALSIILCKGKVSRSSIDYIRGVNSTFALHTLLVRGLVEREQDTKDARVFLYKPTIDLLKHLGVASVNDFPEIAALQKDMKEYD